MLRLRHAPRSVDEAESLVENILPEGYSPSWVKGRADERDRLGFRHWLLILTAVGILYGLVVYQDQRMPNVLGDDQYEKFSEKRARRLLNDLTDLGPRPSGSKACEEEAVKILNTRLKEIQATIDSYGVNRMEVDLQRPSGCYDLKFLSSFTLCYSKVTNIIARVGPRKPSNHSVLVNCHFDSLPDSPGATDDAVSCAIMMEVLDVLSHSEKELKHDVLFLFNGAEENFLQASHGFITQHPWRHTIRAFINLEGAGASGREILFQAGPGNSWLLQTYLENAPHPHCSVLAQEIFQAGLIPSDTDFRVFRDYGRLSGLDIAYFRNGWVYHTEFDLPTYVYEGVIQRAGDNVLAVVKALIESPYIEQPADFDEHNKWVFYDVIGLFTIFYPVSLGRLMNYFTCLAVLIVVACRLQKGVYGLNDLLWAFVHHSVAAVLMFVVGASIAAAVNFTNLTMCWYSIPELVFPLYILPMVITGIAVHSVIAHRYMIKNAEMVHYDSVLLIFAAVLAISTYMGFASAFVFLIHTFFPLLRDPFIYFLSKQGILQRVTSRWILSAQLFAMLPVIVIAAYAAMTVIEFFVPVMGRLGNAINPEYVTMPIGFVIALCFVLYTNNLLYVSRRMDYFIKCACALFALFFVVLLTTSAGWPYRYSEASPRLRRIIALHSKRDTYPEGNGTTPYLTESGLFVQALDYRGVEDLPDNTFFSSSDSPNCSSIPDEYCRFPYYTAIHELFPPSKSRWIPLPNRPPIPNPSNVFLREKYTLSDTELRLSFVIIGGSDKMSLHLTPLHGFKLKKWSFTDIDIEKFGARNTYFVFLTYGFEHPGHRTFWLVLEQKNGSLKYGIDSPSVEISLATHYAHGPNQASDTVSQLRSLIRAKRLVPHESVGAWKWAIAPIIGVSEIVVRIF